ncbi:ABC transporter ATP-binding protein [Cetobacterium sp. 2A]|uniref:ABC transporter ATP-binding protein n=1 Tax=Cetobacterium sp. 2A TaxID=2754723 RepID=UPI00163C776D|nr:ABC transporter ATP-binding protein [Cetobacterium sp. 2A]MBC2856245.1 ABC transporter ATP-binding protein [Cetobacterium sp. 2A]
MEILKVNNLSLSFDKREILKNINFSVKKGEFIGLIGINGSGKTTLLKSLNGINKYSSGEILIDDKNIGQFLEKDLAKKVALMGQNTNLSIPFSCMDIVLMGRYPHLKRGEDFSKVDYDKSKRYMEFTDTLKFEKKFINNLSGGEKQRVFFSKVLAQESEIILLDEPTASLDISHQEEIFKICKELQKENKTLIASIHDLRIAIKYCDKLLLLKDGEIIEFGDIEKVITADNLKKAYGIDVHIYMNEFSKKLDYYIQ